jgi:hypothetical protein
VGDVDEKDQPGHHTQLTDVLSGVALLAWFKRASRDEHTPEGVPALNEHDRAVLHAAHRMASDQERSDRDAVAELLRVAGRHRNRLRKAEIASRRSGHYLDFAVENRAQRLLQAAVTGDAVTEPSPSDRHRFGLIEFFRALPPDRAWDQLVVAVPELADLADQQHAGAFDLPAHFLDQSTPPEQMAAVARDVSARLQALGTRLDALLGPRSGQNDPLLGSVYARRFAFEHLLQRQNPSSGTTPGPL